MRKLIATVFVSALLSIGQVASAGPFEEGESAIVRGDYATALKLLRPLAGQGNAEAQSKLAQMYEWGQGVPQDYAEALRWYRRAADQGDHAGQGSLGMMYLNGVGVPLDYVRGHMWLNLAAARISVSSSNAKVRAAEAKLRDAYSKSRDLAAKLMTPAQIAEAQRLAREWKPKPEK